MEVANHLESAALGTCIRCHHVFLHLHMAQTRGPPFDPRIVRLEPSHGGYTGLGGLSTALEKRCSGSLRSLVGWARFVFATTTYLVSPLRYQCSYLRCIGSGAIRSRDLTLLSYS